MKTKFLPLVLLCFCAFAKAQVGIGTTSPQATLDIPASNPAAPAAEDGILIPRIDEFPATNPTAAQDGMMVFVSGNGSPTKGFYYWNNTTSTWILLNNGGGGTDDQQIDVLNLNGTNLEISLEDDGVATQTLDLSSLGGAQRINDLLDGKSDNDGTDNGSSIFLGENAGSTDNATNNRNIGIGFESLNTNSNGQNNISIGYQSLLNNIGSNNIGIGNLTLTSTLATGFRNIAIGQNTQIATTTGDDNIAIGDNAMVANTLARFNVAIGTRALTSTTTNGQNTAIGYEALTANTGGTNTALGYRSLPANTTGIENVVLGHEAGLLNTGDGNVFLGKSAGAAETTASNKLYIENSNANADNALIYGEFDTNILRTNGEFQINNPTTTGYAFPIADGTVDQVLTTDGAGQLSFQTVTTGGTDTDDQQIDNFSFNTTSNILTLEIQDDGQAAQTVDLSSLQDGTGNDWTLTGNTGTNASTNFLGTTDNVALSFRTNNADKMRLTTKGQLEFFNTGNSTFIGFEAGLMDDLTTNRNVFLGDFSGRNNSSGFSNTAIGYASLTRNTTGAANIAFGTFAMPFNTTGAHNIAIGSNSLASTVSTLGDIAIGSLSLQDKVTGEGNVALGYRAGSNDVDSQRNTYIGYEAGSGLGNGMSPENKTDNIFIGYQSGYNESGSNKLYIENSNATSPLIYGEFDNNILRTNGEFQINNPTTSGYAFPTTDGTASQVLTTDGAGQLSFQTVSTGGTDTDDQQIDVLNLSGTTLQISLQDDGVATQTLNLSSLLGGDITGVTAGAGLTGGGTTGTVTLNAAANNGLNIDAAADRIQLGGPLTETTTITQGIYSLVYNLNSTGDFLIRDNGSNRFAVLDNGRTTVGGITNAGMFNVTGSSFYSDDLYLRDGAVNGINLVRLYDSSDDGVIDVYQGGAVRNRIHGNADSYFNGGEVGFGTTVPSATVDIVGDFQYVDGNQSAGYLLTSDNAGNASWSDPSFIAGAERINDLIDGKSDNDGTQDGSSIFLGIDAGNNDDGTDNGNVGIGFESLTNNSGGIWNVANGYQTLNSNILGSANVANGYQALFFNRADFNVAAGYRALYNNTTAIGNVATGYRALFSNTTGTLNIAYGSEALLSNTTGSGNIAIGHQAGFTATSSNKLYIENGPSATPLIYGDFNTNDVGINWNSAIALPNTLSVNGNASKTTAGAWLANSDARLKKDIKTMDSQAMLDKVLAMRGVTYFWDDDKTGLERPDTIQYGFIAQDLQEIWPTNVSEDGQGYLQTAYGDYDAMFVAAFKAQQEQIDQLKKENQELKNQVNTYASLEARLQQLEESLRTAATPNVPASSTKE